MGRRQTSECWLESRARCLEARWQTPPPVVFPGAIEGQLQARQSPRMEGIYIEGVDRHRSSQFAGVKHNLTLLRHTRSLVVLGELVDRLAIFRRKQGSRELGEPVVRPTTKIQASALCRDQR